VSTHDHLRPLPPPLVWLQHSLEALILLGGIGMILIVFGNALSRLILDIDMASSLELGTFLMLWVTFLGGAVAEARGAHLRVRELVNQLPHAPRRVVLAAVDLIVIGVLTSLVWIGVGIAESNWEQQTSVLYWPLGLMYTCIPVGSGFTLVFALWHIWVSWSEDARPAGA